MTYQEAIYNALPASALRIIERKTTRSMYTTIAQVKAAAKRRGLLG